MLISRIFVGPSSVLTFLTNRVNPIQSCWREELKALIYLWVWKLLSLWISNHWTLALTKSTFPKSLPFQVEIVYDSQDSFKPEYSKTSCLRNCQGLSLDLQQFFCRTKEAPSTTSRMLLPWFSSHSGSSHGQLP